MSSSSSVIGPLGSRRRELPGALRHIAADRRAAGAHGIVITLALACWALSLGGVNLGRVSGYGLLAALPPSYYAALTAIAVGFVVCATARDAPPAVLAAYVVALVVMLHATAPAVFPEPRYAWTYKHLGVIDAIAAHGTVDRSVDIYQNWPGFFALVAWFQRAVGLPAEAFAAWAQPAFELLFVAVAAFSLRGVTRNSRHVWIAVWLFVVANWIGQDYLAPQAVGFALALGVTGIILRASPLPESRLRARALAALPDALVRRLTAAPEGAGRALSSRAAIALAGACSVAVVVSHQLSPIFILLSLVVLFVASGRPPLWCIAALAAVEAWWLWQASDFLSAHFKLFAPSTASSARPVADLGHSLPGVSLGATASRAAIVILLLSAGLGVVRRWRRGARDAIPLALAAAPFLVLGVQSYDGEGPLRAYLFALPWLGFFAAAGCGVSLPGQRAVQRAAMLGGVTLAVGAGTLFGYFGQDMVNQMAPEDVAASRWYLDNAPNGSTLALVAPNFPERLNRRYVRDLSTPRTLLGEQASPLRTVDPPEARRIAVLLRRDRGGPHFLIVSPSQARYARYYGLGRPGFVEALVRNLRASPMFRLAFRAGDAWVFRLS